ncbi:MAG TPA: hypothetical protein PKW35_18725, partial [Nannocystaceae bacterium]|nr:hypothetical protein [Nannocystaceae bacterium]
MSEMPEVHGLTLSGGIGRSRRPLVVARANERSLVYTFFIAAVAVAAEMANGTDSILAVQIDRARLAGGGEGNANGRLVAEEVVRAGDGAAGLAGPRYWRAEEGLGITDEIIRAGDEVAGLAEFGHRHAEEGLGMTGQTIRAGGGVAGRAEGGGFEAESALFCTVRSLCAGDEVAGIAE